MKSLISLWNILAEELASRCSTSTTMDIKTVHWRVENEGLSFLTITLPSYGKDFQYCLDQGMIAPEVFPSFKKDHSWLPSFLRGFTEQVFDSSTGILLDEPDIESIYAVRQLTLMFGKMVLPCTPARERKAMSDYVQCDMEVNDADSRLPSSDLSEFGRLGRLLFGQIFSEVDSDIYHERIVPKHGPGTVAEKLTSNGKYLSRYWTTRLEKIFHFGDFLFPSPRYFSEDSFNGVDLREPGSELPSRVVSVPKTQKAPRIIAIEPSSVQYVQQGILESISRATEKSFISQFLSSVSQEPNQLLARKGSLDGSLATLDLSEASDRVSARLVSELLARHPLSKEAVFACRSEKADVPGHGVIPLSKFASMGSALCFPIEAMVFLTIIFLGIQKERGYLFSRKEDFYPFLGQVRVYGDDLVVPIDCVHTGVDQLEHFGARVGRRKSFWIGRFRESCGKEYYSGHDVSIVKVRRNFPSQRQHVAETVSLVSLRNQFYEHGCWRTADWLDSKIRKILTFFPNVESTSSALGRLSFLGYSAEKECEQLHVPLVKACVLSSKSPRDNLDGEGALLKYFLKRGSNPRFDERHLERAGRPRIAYIKTRWVTPY
jgi:hypothetical protein